MSSAKALIPVERIEGIIIHLRGRKVIIDSDLAKIYGVTTKMLNQAVKRNIHRFPSDFLFQLSPKEKEEVVTICDHLLSLKFSPHLPFAFTEHGAIMAASVLNSNRAIQVSVFVVRAFIKLREIASRDKEISRRLEDLEKGPLRKFTPCRYSSLDRIVEAISIVHTELVFIHPFRDGNGRVGRLLAILMALQAGLPPLDFSGIAGKKKRTYFAAVQEGMTGNYGMMEKIFRGVIDRTLRLHG